MSRRLKLGVWLEEHEECRGNYGPFYGGVYLNLPEEDGVIMPPSIEYLQRKYSFEIEKSDTFRNREEQWLEHVNRISPYTTESGYQSLVDETVERCPTFQHAAPFLLAEPTRLKWIIDMGADSVEVFHADSIAKHFETLLSAKYKEYHVDGGRGAEAEQAENARSGGAVDSFEEQVAPSGVEPATNAAGGPAEGERIGIGGRGREPLQIHLRVGVDDVLRGLEYHARQAEERRAKRRRFI